MLKEKGENSMKKGVFLILLALLMAAGCSIVPESAEAEPQALSITVTATPASVRSKPAIVVGVRNEASAIGWDGYAFTVENGRVVLYSAGAELKELADRRCEGSGSKAPMELRVDIEGTVIRCYVLDDAPGVEPWPEIELNIELPAAYKVECLDLAGKDAKFENLQLTHYTPKTYENTYINPVYDSLADPDVVYEDGTFYLYGTGSTMGYGVHTSTDLVNWGRRGTAVYGTLWGITRNYWAPDLEYVDGKWWMAVSCDQKLGFATSEDLMGPFTEIGETPGFGRAIDGHIFIDDDGRRYFYYVNWDTVYGIYGVELDENMEPIEGTTKLLIYPTEDWETGDNITEGPFMLKHNGLYYLTYSGNGYEHVRYAVGYAVSESPLGPFEKYEHNPILVGNSQIHGVGHHCCVTIPETGEIWMVYHCHNSLTEVQQRKICIDRMRFSPVEGDIDRLEVYGPTVTPQPYPDLGINE